MYAQDNSYMYAQETFLCSRIRTYAHSLRAALEDDRFMASEEVVDQAISGKIN
jgi:hypothetical protein